MTVLRGILQLCILVLFAASLAIYRLSDFISIAGVCFFFGALFAATFLLGTGAAEKLTERRIFLAFESFALILVVGGVLSKTDNLIFVLIVALAVWWGGMIAFLVNPVVGQFREEKAIFRSLASKEISPISRLQKYAFAFFYAPIFVKKDCYFWGLLVIALLYLVGKHYL